MSDEFFIEKMGGAWMKRERLDEYMRSLQSGRYKVTIEKKDKRSNQQNRYYFGQVVALVQKGIKDLGHDLTKEETHEFLKAKFNYKELVNEETGEVLSLPISTTRLNKTDFGEYISKIQQFAAEFLGIIIPDPNHQLECFT